MNYFKDIIWSWFLIIGTYHVQAQSYVYQTHIDSLNPYEYVIQLSTINQSFPGSYEVLGYRNSDKQINITRSSLVLPPGVTIDSLTGKVLLPENDTSTYWFISFHPTEHKFAFLYDQFDITWNCNCGGMDRDSPNSCKFQRIVDGGNERIDCINDGDCDACKGEVDLKLEGHDIEYITQYGGVIVKAPKIHYYFVWGHF